MKNKYRKQKRNIIIKITAVLFAVWLIVSVAFSAIALTLEKNKQISQCTTDFNDLTYRISVSSNPTYNSLCSLINTIKTNYAGEYFVTQGYMMPEIKYGTDGAYDSNVHILAYVTSGDENYQAEPLVIMDTDKEIYLTLRVKNEFEEISEYCGNVVYNDFVKSIKAQELNTIIDYLKIKRDKDGYYYAVQCKEAYYNAENGHLIPKTIELVKTHDDYTWSEQNEVIDTFKLNPDGVKGLDAHTLAGDTECIIDGKFITGEFSSGGLIEEPFKPLDYGSDLTVAHADNYLVEKESLFTYNYMSYDFSFFSTHGYRYGELENAFYEQEQKLYEEISTQLLPVEEESKRWDEFYNDADYMGKILDIKYVKHIDLLECAKETLTIGISSLFLFFLTIGVILTIMMCKVLKTQLNEEQKRADITNALAHDIKTPLFIISGYAQSLKENINTDKREHYCNRIIDRTEEVNSLVHTMLDFSKLEQIEDDLKFNNINVFELTNEVIARFDGLVSSDEIKLNLNGECNIFADKELMQRVVTNLVDNAIRYKDENTDITVNIEDKALSVSNICSNITKEDVKHLTEPYYKVEKNRKADGNGLGLSIVKSIVDLHGYKLDITLNDSKITFTISFKK